MSTFQEKATAITRTSVVGLGASMAWDVGIFHALLEADTPQTSTQVANAKGLKERYVRELLGCLSTAELIQVSAGEDGTLLYSLDDEDKKAMKVGAGAAMGFPGALSSLYSSMKSCISADGPNGVRYTDSVQKYLDERLEFGAPKMVTAMLENVQYLPIWLRKGMDVLEVGAGGARLSALFATQFPRSKFVASEVNTKLVESNKTRWAHIPNLSFSVQDVCALPEIPEKLYDVVLCNDVIHDLPDPLKALQGIRRLLRDKDRKFLFIDIATSGSPVQDKGNMGTSYYYAASTFLCIPESYQNENSVALGACWGKSTALKLIKDAGFEVQDIMLDPYHALYICTLPWQR